MCIHNTNAASEGNTSTSTTEESGNQGEQRVNITPQNNSIELWHHRFCHINTNALRQTEQAVYGMKIQDNKTHKFFVKDVFLVSNNEIHIQQYKTKRETPYLVHFFILTCAVL